MTPKEKAQELYDLMRHEISQNDTRLDVFGINFIAKQCALIAVDEIINIRSNDSAFNNFLWSTNNEYYNVFYLKNWEQVKQEIEKL